MLRYLIPVFGFSALMLAQRGRVDAVVLNLQGSWSLRNAKVGVFQKVPAGARLDCSTADRDWLEYVSSGRPTRLICTTSPIGIPLQPAAPNSSFWTTLAATLARAEPALPVPAGVRAFRNPLDAALPRSSAGQIDVSNALRTLNPSRYRLKFLPFRGSREAVLAQLDLTWDKANPAKISNARLVPGLYRLQVLTADDEEEEVGTWVAVFVGPKDRCAEANRQLEVARRALGKGLSDMAKQAIYIAILSSF
jgi:hypothetical protein